MATQRPLNHQTAGWRFGAIPPGKGVASLLQVYPRMPPLSSSTGSNSISGRHCVFTWDNTCCSYTAGYTLYYTCVHGRRWHVQVSCLYYIRLYNFKSHNLFKEVASQRPETKCALGVGKECRVARFFSGGKQWHPAQPRLKLESSQFRPHVLINWAKFHGWTGTSAMCCNFIFTNLAIVPIAFFTQYLQHAPQIPPL